MSQEDYEALISFAQKGVRGSDAAAQQGQAVALDGLLKSIEKENGIVRYSLWVQWQDPNQPLPPNTRFPYTWPPEMRSFIQFLSRPIAKSDVLALVAQRAPNAVNILVTPDPGALLGWTDVDQYFVMP